MDKRRLAGRDNGGMGDEIDPGLPLKLGRCSNGEFVPPPLGAVAHEAMRRARRISEDAARRLGWSRRRFLASSGAMAAGLLALQACSDEARRAAQPDAGSTGAPATAGGRLTVPGTGSSSTVATAITEAAALITEPEAATTALRTDELIIDVQNHFLDYELHPDAVAFGQGFPQASCGEADFRACFSAGQWADLVLRQSDTTMAVLSAIPVVGDANPLTIEAMEHGKRVAAELCGDRRVLIQGQATPDVGRLDAALAAMEELRATHDVAAWKVYTHAPSAWALDDTAIGEPFLAKVAEIGPPIVAVHKGLAGGSEAASPRDIGPAARNHPDLTFLVYHSGKEGAVTEGRYDPGALGVDRLIRSLEEAEIGPGSNVYAELGSTWRLVMGNLDEAAHLLGKLLVAVGEDNILWGTDSIWYGSPQDQIAIFRSFEITEAYQEQFGYPALTPSARPRFSAATRPGCSTCNRSPTATPQSNERLRRCCHPARTRRSVRSRAATCSPPSVANTPGSTDSRSRPTTRPARCRGQLLRAV